MKQISRVNAVIGSSDQPLSPRLGDALQQVSTNSVAAAQGLINALGHVENNTGDTSRTASALASIIRKKIDGHQLDEVIPVVPKVLGRILQRVPTTYDGVSKRNVGDILAASVLGLDRSAVDGLFRGISPASAASFSPGALRQLISLNLKAALDSLGYEANLTNLYEPVASWISSPSPVNASADFSELPMRYETSLSATQIQHMLNTVLDSDNTVSGIFDDSTTESVRVFQNLYGLVPDGIVGPSTSAALLSLFGNVGR